MCLNHSIFYITRLLTTAEILKKVKALEIKSRKLTSDLFTGEYHSAFKGKGMLFKEVREYQAGDDTRFIDWNVSARFGHPYSKLFEEERELTVMLLVDISASSLFGTSNAIKKDLITEISAMLGFSAINNHDKVGMILFSDKIEKYIPPKKGKQHALVMVRELLAAVSVNKKTSLAVALKHFTNINKQRGIAFILSDMLDADYENALKVAGNKHDIIGIKVYDNMDVKLPDAGLWQIRDPETGEEKWVDTSSSFVRQQYQQSFFDMTAYSKTVFTKAGCDLLHIRTDEDYVKVLQRFFLGRNR
jgi:uncharacterized protein (DUF58 family)